MNEQKQQKANRRKQSHSLIKIRIDQTLNTTMDDHVHQGIINYPIEDRHIPLRFWYIITEEEIKIRINYMDLAQIIRETNSRNLRELHLHFELEVEFTGGEKHHIRFIIPENVMNASADELEARSRNNTP